MINRSASCLATHVAGKRGQALRLAPASLALVLALALAGCGSNAARSETEARLIALEKKVEAADKRSRQALSMAMQPNSAPPVDNGPMFDDGGFDSEPENFSGEDQDGIPASPMLGPEG